MVIGLPFLFFLYLRSSPVFSEHTEDDPQVFLLILNDERDNDIWKMPARVMGLIPWVLSVVLEGLAFRFDVVPQRTDAGDHAPGRTRLQRARDAEIDPNRTLEQENPSYMLTLMAPIVSEVKREHRRRAGVRFQSAPGRGVHGPGNGRGLAGGQRARPGNRVPGRKRPQSDRQCPRQTVRQQIPTGGGALTVCSRANAWLSSSDGSGSRDGPSVCFSSMPSCPWLCSGQKSIFA